jgi:hypothetical protein
VLRTSETEAVLAQALELSNEERELIRTILQQGLTMTSVQRLVATALACKYVNQQGISGAFVECGVWRGGNSILAGQVFKALDDDRELFLFDTFRGMTTPTAKDTKVLSGIAAKENFDNLQRDDHNEWCYASIDDVKENCRAAGLTEQRLRFIEGDVSTTLKVESNLPKEISVLRLDTDWYESTRDELAILYPRLSTGGILILDDYGSWEGARLATDEFLDQVKPRPFLSIIDSTGRIGTKPT